jgi:hypothetical protein
MGVCQSNRSNEEWWRRLPPPRSSSLRRHGHSPRRRAGSGWLPPPSARRRGSSVSTERCGGTARARSCRCAFVVGRGSPSSPTWSTASLLSIDSTPGGRTERAPICGMRWPRTVEPTRRAHRSLSRARPFSHLPARWREPCGSPKAATTTKQPSARAHHGGPAALGRARGQVIGTAPATSGSRVSSGSSCSSRAKR